jgi:glycosyltransferase involved in cell wall biosynthesis
MRVVLVCDFYPPAPGGLEAHVRRLGQALVRAGHQVAVVAGAEDAAAVDDGGVAVHRVATSLRRLPAAYQRADRAFHPPWPDRAFRRGLGRVLDDFQPDVVHAHGWCEFSVGAACRGRWPVVVTLHDYGLRCPKKNLLRGGQECAAGRGLRCVRCPGDEQGTAKRTVLSAALGRSVPRLGTRVARFIAVSGHVAQRYLETGADPARVVVIPNFLDVPAADFDPPTGSEVLYVGPADRHKGLAVLLGARRQVPAELARFVIVGAAAGGAGDGGSADGGRAGGAGDWRSAGGGCADGAGVEFTGRLTGEALWERFRAAALVVVPSIWPEPCPTVALEALAWGRPVVASRTGGLPDLVAHGSAGILVPPGDPGALAEAITGLLTDRGRLASMARTAHDNARAFETGVVVARIEAVYREVHGEWTDR